MSFPRLVLDGDTTTYTLNSIILEYPNDTNSAQRPTTLTRAKYDVIRDLRVGNVGQVIPNLQTNVPYNIFRLIHRWVGYCDVITDSVAVTSVSDSATLKTVALIKSAIYYNSTNGLPFVCPTFVIEGPTYTSSTNEYVNAWEQGLFWKYQEKPTEKQSINWIIKDISINDNQNNTSRVTFSFEIIEPWVKLETALD